MEYFEIENYRTIKAKYLGPTNYRGSRIKIYDTQNEDFNLHTFGKKTISKTFSYDYEIGNVEEQAFKILIENGWNVVGRGGDFENFIFFCDNWGEDYKHINELK